MEFAHTINEAGNLSGVFSKANSGTDKPVVIMVNSGLLHHIGPYRLYTNLARRMAEAGIDSLRFDLTNVGDSLPGETNLGYITQTNTDIQQAIDFLQRVYNHRKFIILGVCSGADDAFEISKADNRVIGTLLIDGHGYRTPRFYLKHFLVHFGRRIISPQKWATIIDRLKSKFGQSAEEQDQDTRSFEFSEGLGVELTRDVVTTQIDELTARGCKLRFIYTGGVSDYYNYHGQFEDCFPNTRGNSNVSAIWYSDSDHLFMKRTHRELMITGVINWLEENY